MDRYEFKLLNDEYIDNASKIAKDGKDFLKASNSPQWQGRYPDRSDVEYFVQNKQLYGMFLNDVLVAVCVILTTRQEAYDVIYQGKWLTDSSPYISVHMVAIDKDYRGKSLCSKLLDYVSEYAYKHNFNSVRGDTYKLNKIMQHNFEKNGFTKCGIVILKEDKDNNDRIAYEKVVK